MKKDEPQLQDWLRRNDPAAGVEPMSETERESVIDAMRAASLRPHPSVARRFVLAFASVLLLITLGWLITRDIARPPDQIHLTTTETIASETASEPDVEKRQIQFATPGGTRVIWTLDPEFEI